MTDKEYNEWLYRAHFLRSQIIDSTILLERYMDGYIGSYFCATLEKRRELVELLISERVEFSKKAETFIKILNKKCEKEDKKLSEIYPRIATDLQEIAQERNYFAHKPIWQPSNPKNIGDSVIILLSMKDKIDAIRYNQKEFDIIIGKLKKYEAILDKLMAEA